MHATLTRFDCNFRPDSTGVLRITALASDVNSAPKDWVAAISSIPEISNRMLQLFNTSYGGRPGRIASIQHAVVVLGFNTVKTLASRLVLPSTRPSADYSSASM